MTLILSYLLISTRVLAMVFAAPVLGSRHLPILFRVLIGLMISLTALPLIIGFDGQQQGTEIATAGQLVGAMFSEALIGSLIGLGVLIIFVSAEMVGSTIGQMSGIQLDAISSPGDSLGMSPISRLFGIMSAAVFVVIGGPELLISGVLDTFSILSPGQAIDHQQVFPLLGVLLSQSFILAAKAIGPAVAALLITTIAIGMISRTMPQLNLLQVGLTSNVAVMFLAVFLTLGGCVWLFVDDMGQTTNVIQEGLKSAIVEPAR